MADSMIRVIGSKTDVKEAGNKRSSASSDTTSSSVVEQKKTSESNQPVSVDSTKAMKQGDRAQKGDSPVTTSDLGIFEALLRPIADWREDSVVSDVDKPAMSEIASGESSVDSTSMKNSFDNKSDMKDSSKNNSNGKNVFENENNSAENDTPTQDNTDEEHPVKTLVLKNTPKEKEKKPKNKSKNNCNQVNPSTNGCDLNSACSKTDDNLEKQGSLVTSAKKDRAKIDNSEKRKVSDNDSQNNELTTRDTSGHKKRVKKVSQEQTFKKKETVKDTAKNDMSRNNMADLSKDVCLKDSKEVNSEISSACSLLDTKTTNTSDAKSPEIVHKHLCMAEQLLPGLAFTKREVPCTDNAAATPKPKILATAESQLEKGLAIKHGELRQPAEAIASAGGLLVPSSRGGVAAALLYEDKLASNGKLVSDLLVNQGSLRTDVPRTPKPDSMPVVTPVGFPPTIPSQQPPFFSDRAPSSRVREQVALQESPAPWLSGKPCQAVPNSFASSSLGTSGLKEQANTGLAETDIEKLLKVCQNQRPEPGLDVLL